MQLTYVLNACKFITHKKVLFLILIKNYTLDVAHLYPLHSATHCNLFSSSHCVCTFYFLMTLIFISKNNLKKIFLTDGKVRKKQVFHHNKFNLCELMRLWLACLSDKEIMWKQKLSILVKNSYRGMKSCCVFYQKLLFLCQHQRRIKVGEKTSNKIKEWNCTGGSWFKNLLKFPEWIKSG